MPNFWFVCWGPNVENSTFEEMCSVASHTVKAVDTHSNKKRDILQSLEVAIVLPRVLLRHVVFIFFPRIHTPVKVLLAKIFHQRMV